MSYLAMLTDLKKNDAGIGSVTGSTPTFNHLTSKIFSLI